MENKKYFEVKSSSAKPSSLYTNIQIPPLIGEERIRTDLSMGIYTTFLHSKNNGLQQLQAPSPAGEGWGEENEIN